MPASDGRNSGWEASTSLAGSPSAQRGGRPPRRRQHQRGDYRGQAAGPVGPTPPALIVNARTVRQSWDDSERRQVYGSPADDPARCGADGAAADRGHGGRSVRPIPGGGLRPRAGRSDRQQLPGEGLAGPGRARRQGDRRRPADVVAGPTRTRRGRARLSRRPLSALHRDGRRGQPQLGDLLPQPDAGCRGPAGKPDADDSTELAPRQRRQYLQLARRTAARAGHHRALPRRLVRGALDGPDDRSTAAQARSPAACGTPTIRRSPGSGRRW